MNAKHICFLVSMAIAAALGNSSAEAGPQHQCTKYAKDAIQQIQKNYDENCGFSGPRWANNEAAHHFWCIQPGTTIGMISGEDQARKNDLSVCMANAQNTGSAPRPATALTAQQCENYKNAMSKFAKENIKMKCGYTGGRFDDNPTGHYNWCYEPSNTKAIVGAEMESAEKAIAQCQAKIDTNAKYEEIKQKDCLAYAQEAVKLDAEIRDVCPSSDAWPQEVNAHVEWCMNSNIGNANFRNTRRSVEILTCKSDKKAAATITFPHSGRKHDRVRGFLPVDVCPHSFPKSAEGLIECGANIADAFCNFKGYAKAIDSPKKNYNNGSNMDGDLPTTWWMGSDSFCTGKCTGFEYITCKGKI